jgi:hypothetical protein
MNLYDATGRVIDHQSVVRSAGERMISLRTGCFCNPGAGEVALGLSSEELSPCFGRAEQLRLIQFDGPFPLMVPMGEGWGRFQRILAVADEEIAQTEFCGIVFHSQTGIGLRLWITLIQMHNWTWGTPTPHDSF